MAVNGGDLEPIRRKLEAGERLSPGDAETLLASRDLLAVGELASAANRARHGDRVFYNVNRHINPTNICVNRCRFCAFSRSEGEAGAYALSAEEVLERAGEAAAAGATELHIVGGLHPTLPLEWYLEVLAAIRDRHPGLHLKGFTAVEIDHFAILSGRDAAGVLEALQAAGLGSLPGGGAEILAEDTRRKICPEKISGRRWLEIMEMLPLKEDHFLLTRTFRTSWKILIFLSNCILKLKKANQAYFSIFYFFHSRMVLIFVPPPLVPKVKIGSLKLEVFIRSLIGN